MLFKQLPDQLTPDLKPIVTETRLKGAWMLMKGYRLPYIGAGLALGISTGARTASLLLIQYFIDRYLAQGDRTYALWMIAFGFVVLAALQGGFTFISGALSAHTAESIAQRLRNFVLNHLQRLSFAYHDEVQTGELIQRATSDIDALRRFYAIEFVESSRILFLFLINFTTIWILNWQLALDLGHCHTDYLDHVYLLLPADLHGLRSLSDPRCCVDNDVARELDGRTCCQSLCTPSL